MSNKPSQGEFDFENGEPKMPSKSDELRPQIELASKLQRIKNNPLNTNESQPKGPSEARQEETSYEGRRTQADINRDGMRQARQALENSLEPNSDLE